MESSAIKCPLAERNGSGRDVGGQTYASDLKLLAKFYSAVKIFCVSCVSAFYINFLLLWGKWFGCYFCYLFYVGVLVTCLDPFIKRC